MSSFGIFNHLWGKKLSLQHRNDGWPVSNTIFANHSPGAQMVRHSYQANIATWCEYNR